MVLLASARHGDTLNERSQAASDPLAALDVRVSAGQQDAASGAYRVHSVPRFEYAWMCGEHTRQPAMSELAHSARNARYDFVSSISYAARRSECNVRNVHCEGSPPAAPCTMEGACEGERI